MDINGEPACDISGLCEPFDEEEHELAAMCQHCGGWRYKDHPYPGNWGIECTEYPLPDDHPLNFS